MDEMKIVLWDEGDSSVGLKSKQFEIIIKGININDESFNYKNNREIFRREIREIGELLGLERAWGREKSIKVFFEDECFECGSRLKRNDGCSTKYCINNYHGDV